MTRFGGDEFAILARELAGRGRDQYRVARDQGVRPADRHRTADASCRRGHRHRAFPQDGPGEIELLRRADIALYRAKEEKPKSTLRFFDADMDARTQERDQIERDLPRAIVKGDVRPTISR